MANVKNIVLHEFRHSHASYLINKGVSPLVVAQRLGHSDVATTLNTYSHLYPSKQAEAVAFMENDLV
ncbi:protein YdcL [Bacillus thuringiensis serovar tolworthi]|uniref:Protein YdcL n=2 Tax=Bacillus cereus group TaxID=86661 RepID=A0A9W4EX51_BACTO|nr:protein YdcL [Bacillus thuringiensis serovar tolworthi]